MPVFINIIIYDDKPITSNIITEMASTTAKGTEDFDVEKHNIDNFTYKTDAKTYDKMDAKMPPTLKNPPSDAVLGSKTPQVRDIDNIDWERI